MSLQSKVVWDAGEIAGSELHHVHSWDPEGAS